MGTKKISDSLNGWMLMGAWCSESEESQNEMVRLLASREHNAPCYNSVQKTRTHPISNVRWSTMGKLLPQRAVQQTFHTCR